MRYGAWIIAVALGLAASLGQAQEQAEETDRSAQTEQPQTIQIPTPFPVKIVEDETEAITRQRQEAEARQRDIDDLLAQQGMELATRAMNQATQEMRDYAYAQTIIVGIGTVLVFLSLLIAIFANRAAFSAISVARAIGQAQTRAYLGISSVTLFQQERSGDERCKIRVKNYGVSPAINVSISAQCFYTEDNLEIEPDKFSVLLQNGVIHPGAELSVGFNIDIAKTIFGLGIIDYSENDKLKRVVGEVKYTDAFGRQCRTGISFFVIDEAFEHEIGGRRFNLSVADTGNEAN